MLRAELIKAREYLEKQEPRRRRRAKRASRRGATCAWKPWAACSTGEQPLMITAARAQDIASALRLAKEFDIKIWLDGADEAYLLDRRNQGGRRARDPASHDGPGVCRS